MIRRSAFRDGRIAVVALNVLTVRDAQLPYTVHLQRRPATLAAEDQLCGRLQRGLRRGGADSSESV